MRDKINYMLGGIKCYEKKIAWKKDEKCWGLGAEIFLTVAREGFTEKVTFQWRSERSEGASYRAI